MLSIILFVEWAGTQRLKKCVQKWSKIDQKVQNLLPLWLFWELPGVACRINEVLVLVFN